MQLTLESQASAPAECTAILPHITLHNSILAQCKSEIYLFQSVTASGSHGSKLIGRSVASGSSQPTCCISSTHAIYVGNSQGQIVCASAYGDPISAMNGVPQTINLHA
jgi:hypothetical protein